MIEIYFFTFKVFLNEKYGKCGTPVNILAVDFEKLFTKVTDTEKEVLSQWYSLDQHTVPHTYILQPIRNNIPRYGEVIDGDEDLQEQVMMQWLEMESTLSNIFHNTADNDFANKYLNSSKSIYYIILYHCNYRAIIILSSVKIIQ